MRTPWRETWPTWLMKWALFLQLLVKSAPRADCNRERVCVYMSPRWKSRECACRVRRLRRARTRRDPATRRGRTSETAEERAKSWVKSARRQKAQTLKILLLIHNDAAVLDIFKFIPCFLFLSLFDNTSALQTICASKHVPHQFFFLKLAVMNKRSRIMTWIRVFMNNVNE